MLSDARQMEIYKKIVDLGKVEKSKPLNNGLIQGEYTELSLEVSIPELLVGLGVVTSETEAQDFLTGTITSSVMAAAAGLQDGSQMLHDLVKFGFFLGVLSNRVGTKGSN